MRVMGTTYTKSAPPLQFRWCSTEAPNGGNLWELYKTAAIQDGFLLALNLLFQPPKCAQLAIVIMEPGVSSETGLLHPSSGTGLTSAVLKCQPSQQTSSPFAWLCLALNFQQRSSKVMAAVVKWGHRESRHCCTRCSETHLHSATTCSWHSCLQWYLHITPLYPSRFSSVLLQCVPTLSFLSAPITQPCCPDQEHWVQLRASFGTGTPLLGDADLPGFPTASSSHLNTDWMRKNEMSVQDKISSHSSLRSVRVCWLRWASNHIVVKGATMLGIPGKYWTWLEEKGISEADGFLDTFLLFPQCPYTRKHTDSTIRAG